MVFFWITGNVFGFILQRARFCFTASLRDPYLTGGTTLTKAVLTAFAITSIGFIAIQYGAVSKGLPMPGQAYVVPISAATAIGAFMFGIGMVIAGGCASGTCMRVGEGFHMQILSLFFFVVGSSGVLMILDGGSLTLSLREKRSIFRMFLVGPELL